MIYLMWVVDSIVLHVHFPLAVMSAFVEDGGVTLPSSVLGVVVVPSDVGRVFGLTLISGLPPCRRRWLLPVL